MFIVHKHSLSHSQSEALTYGYTSCKWSEPLMLRLLREDWPGARAVRKVCGQLSYASANSNQSLGHESHLVQMCSIEKTQGNCRTDLVRGS